MHLDEVRQALVSAGVKVLSADRLPNNKGHQLTLEGGGTVACYDSGKHVVQGKKADKDRINAILGDDTNNLPKRKPIHRVFVVYGHDRTARDQLEVLLRRWGLEPMILDQLPSEGQTIIEKLESVSDGVSFAVVLATPDDEGHRATHSDEKSFRARQNVVLELGMLLAKLGRPRVAILLKDQVKMEKPSDIQGLIYIPFKDDIARDAGVLLAKELNAQGYPIDIGRL